MVFTPLRFEILVLIAILAIGIGIVTATPPGQGPAGEVRLTPDESSPDTEYGRSVAIDGNIVAVGMGGDGDEGSVYLYRREGTQYVLEAKLVDPDSAPGAEFGRTVAIQGDMVVVGARFADVDGLNAGAVYVFRRSGDSWQYGGEKIVSPLPQAGDNFGRALAIQGDLLVVTARKNAAERGAAYLFVLTDEGWADRGTLVAYDSADGDYFGQSVALRGNILAIGARDTSADPSDPASPRTGGFYLFRQSGGEWVEVAKVTPEDGNDEDQFGFTLAISGDTLVAGARRGDKGGLANAGAAYVYSLKGDGVSFVAKLTAEDAKAGDEFGQALACAGDLLAVGAWKDDAKQGSIHLFRQNGGRWIQTGTIRASDGVPGDEFGYSLAASGNRLVTGAHKADSVAKDSGAAYVIPISR